MEEAYDPDMLVRLAVDVAVEAGRGTPGAKAAGAIIATLAKAQRDVAELVETLRSLEWEGRDAHCPHMACDMRIEAACPFCEHTSEDGHAADCGLAALLEKHKEG